MPESHNQASTAMNIAFYPWFSLGHLTSFLRLANNLAERGHNVSYYVPTKTQSKLVTHNHYPDHLTFIPIEVPPVDGLSPGAETTNDVSASAAPLIMTALDLTRDTIDSHLALLKPDLVFYDLAYWMPELGRKHGFKSVYYIDGYIARFGSIVSHIIVPDLQSTPALPSPHIFRMRAYEARTRAAIENLPFGLKGLTLLDIIGIGIRDCDAIAAKTCKEMEGAYCEFFEKTLGRPVLLAGPLVPKPPSTKLDERFHSWLKGFGAASVIYCALGSECVLPQTQFQELLLGLELTGRPFLAALKPPKGCDNVESALPVGFTDRIRDRGIIYGGWVQQLQILKHLSVGCFVTHCGVGSLTEAMVSKCQVVMMPQAFDQFTNARQMSLELKIGVEIEPREDDGLFTKEAVHEAISKVMDEGSEVGTEVKANHTKWREFISNGGLEDSYINSFIQNLQQLLV